MGADSVFQVSARTGLFRVVTKREVSVGTIARTTDVAMHCRISLRDLTGHCLSTSLILKPSKRNKFCTGSTTTRTESKRLGRRHPRIHSVALQAIACPFTANFHSPAPPLRARIITESAQNNYSTEAGSSASTDPVGSVERGAIDSDWESSPNPSMELPLSPKPSIDVVSG